MSPKLTPKQAAFVAEYLVDLNASAAARRAGYSERTADAIGRENLGKPTVAAAVRAAMQARQQRTEVNADWVLKRLAQLADADLADLYGADGGLLPVDQWPEVWRRGLVAGIETIEERVDGVVVGQLRKVKLADRVKLLELLGRHVDVGAFRERVELTGKNGGPVAVDVSGMSSEAMREIVEARRRAGR